MRPVSRRYDDAVLQAHRQRHDVCVDHVRGPRPQQHPADATGIGESEVVNLEGAEEPRQPGRAAAISPHLSDHRRRRAQHLHTLQGVFGIHVVI